MKTGIRRNSSQWLTIGLIVCCAATGSYKSPAAQAPPASSPVGGPIEFAFSDNGTPNRDQPAAKPAVSERLSPLDRSVPGGEPSDPNIRGERIRVRISWGGGGTPIRLQGKLSMDSGALANTAVLGMTDDASGSVVADGRDLHIHSWSATHFGGVDVTLDFQPDSQLAIELSDDSEEKIEFDDRIQIARLIHENYVQPLDSAGNRLVITRLESDRLPLRMERQHLIFEPGEKFEFWVRANHCGTVSQRMNGRLRIKPIHAADDHAAGAGIHRLTSAFNHQGAPHKIDLGVFELNDVGSSIERLVEISLPQEEGVYQLVIELSNPWQTASAASSLRRTIEVVVLSRQPLQDASSNRSATWKKLTRINPAVEVPAWQANLREVGRLAGLSEDSYLSSRNIGRRVVGEKEMVELPPGGWQAITLITETLDQPHLVEIEYLSGRPMAVGMSILQPNTSGQIPFYGVDSGIFYPKNLVESGSEQELVKPKKHRVVFWPKQRKSYLLIANRDRNHSAVIGEIELFQGPRRLPATDISATDISVADLLTENLAEAESSRAEVAAAERLEADRALTTQTQGALTNRTGGRQFLAFYESPLFVQNFGARQALDNPSGQRLDDWLTFYQAADRLIQYLKSNGYSGAMITVACDGSSLYPSSFIGSTPKLDTGVFFSNGQDPIRKDVVELLMRMFEREGLTLIPALNFSSPLPQVELYRRLQPESSESVALVNFNGTTAQQTMKNHLPIYNPLDPLVQQTITLEVAEFCRRYGGHSSFRGLGIICRPDSYSLLPGQQWVYDGQTVNRFLTSLGRGATAPETWKQMQNLLMGDLQQAWLNWRAESLHRWYQEMLRQVQLVVPQGRLMIAPVDLYRNEELQMTLAPNLHTSTDFRRQMLRLGWVADHFAETPGLALLRPRRIAPNDTLANRRVEIGLDNLRQVDEFYQRAESIGELYSHRNAWAHFAELQQQPPFQQHQGNLMRLQPLVPAASWNRQRFLNSFRTADPQFLIDGGWLLPVGQERELHDLIASFRQLPNQTFQDVPMSMGELRPSQVPVLVRQFSTAQQTWFYAVNPSPWPVKVRIDIDPVDHEGGPAEVVDAGAFEFLSRISSSPMVESIDQGQASLELELEPLSFFAARSKIPLSLTRYQFSLPENSADRLRKLVYSLQSKLNLATQAQPLSILKNPSFEQSPGNTLYGWNLGIHDRAEAKLESDNPLEGDHYLRITNRSDQSVWVRSHHLPIPATGRLSISVWLRTSNPDQQPPLRIAIEGVLSDSHYYRFGSVGKLSPHPQSNQLAPQWQRFAVHFDDLPIEGVSDLRIGFDLMGTGEVQIDKLEVYDRWLDDRDAKAITQRLASCGPLLANPSTYESGRLLLQSYWLRFLDEQFSFDSAVASDGSSPTEGERPDNLAAEQQAQSELEEGGNQRGVRRRLRRQSNR